MCVTRVLKGVVGRVQVVMMFVVEDDDDDGLTHQVEYFKDRVKKSFPPTNFEFSLKALAKANNVAKSRGKLGNYIRWLTSRKHCKYRVKWLFRRCCSGCRRNNVVIILPAHPPTPPQKKASPESDAGV